MKKTFFIFIFLSLRCFSSSLEARPVADLISLVKMQNFKYVETGLGFGFVSIQSCMYMSEEVIILQNYCFPKKEYPAKGFTIISEKFGVVDLYQEKFEITLKKDIEITSFGENLKKYLKAPYDKISLFELNKIIEKIYYQNEPACWSTNFSYSNGEPVVNCSTELDQILHFENWAKETQAITLDETRWKNLIQEVESKISVLNFNRE